MEKLRPSPVKQFQFKFSYVPRGGREKPLTIRASLRDAYLLLLYESQGLCETYNKSRCCNTLTQTMGESSFF